MAAIARRTWAQLKTEFLSAARGINYSGWSSRAEYLLYEAYLDICGLYHHKELEETASGTLTGSPQYQHYILFETNAHMIVGVAETTSAGLPELFLDQVHFAVWAGVFQGTTSSEYGQPKQWAQFNRIIYFDRKTDASRHYRIYYIRRPADPDFSGSDSPEIAPIWDTHIIELALMRAGVRTGDQMLATINAQAYRDFVSQQPQPLLKDSMARAFANTDTTDKPTSGDLT